MNHKEVKELQHTMKDMYGAWIEGDFMMGSKGRIYLVTRPVTGVDVRKVNAEGVGVYVGRINPEGFRPSIEGVQLMRPTKNIFELNEDQMKDWIMGFKITIETEYQGYCTLTYKGEIIGPGKIANKGVWNYVPKERRIKKITDKI